jgi:hypothetical protein
VLLRLVAVRRDEAIVTRVDVPGVLLLYHRHFVPNASTVMEHAGAFKRYSDFAVWNVNTELGFPDGFEECRFQVIVLHYSLFSPIGYHLNQRFLEYLDRSHASYKIAFFQDEHHFCQQRFAFLNRYNFDCVYTLVEPPYFQDVYRRYTNVPHLVYSIPGYVPDDLEVMARRYRKPDHERRIDVGYRGRKLAAYMGRGAREKYDIAVGFSRRAAGSGLKLDIEADEHRRIYGKQWYRFMADCRAVLGVEAGVSIFDVEDRVRPEYERLTARNPRASFEELSTALLDQWEGNIPYRTISPRHFEAAAFRACQILFEGNYSGIMQPMVHYIPLKKDFSNFDDVLRMFRDEALRRELTENAYRDLIASGRYSYRRFVEGFDEELRHVGIQPEVAPDIVQVVNQVLNRGRLRRESRARLLAARHYPFPGRRFVRPLAKPILRRLSDAGATRFPRTDP